MYLDMSNATIPFQLISHSISQELCSEFQLQSEELLLEYRSQLKIIIRNTTFPTYYQQIYGDGNCLYRAVCFSIAGSDNSYMQLKQKTASELQKNCGNFEHIPANFIKSLIKEAEQNGAYGEVRHLIALSAALKIKIYVFNRSTRPPQWDTILAVLKPECHPIQVYI